MGRVVLDLLDNRRFVRLEYVEARPETIILNVSEDPRPNKSRADVVRGVSSSLVTIPPVV